MFTAASPYFLPHSRLWVRLVSVYTVSSGHGQVCLWKCNSAPFNLTLPLPLDEIFLLYYIVLFSFLLKVLIFYYCPCSNTLLCSSTRTGSTPSCSTCFCHPFYFLIVTHTFILVYVFCVKILWSKQCHLSSYLNINTRPNNSLPFIDFDFLDFFCSDFNFQTRIVF